MHPKPPGPHESRNASRWCNTVSARGPAGTGTKIHSHTQGMPHNIKPSRSTRTRQSVNHGHTGSGCLHTKEANRQNKHKPAAPPKLQLRQPPPNNNKSYAPTQPQHSITRKDLCSSGCLLSNGANHSSTNRAATGNYNSKPSTAATANPQQQLPSTTRHNICSSGANEKSLHLQ